MRIWEPYEEETEGWTKTQITSFTLLLALAIIGFGTVCVTIWNHL